MSDELVDPQETLRAECSADPHCSHAKADLDACTQRVNSRLEKNKDYEETCSQELYDFMHSVDHCVSKTLFSRLK